MKLLNKLMIVIAGAATLGFGGMQSANAGSLEMVTNGEFEQTSFTSNWTRTTTVPGWQTTGNGQFELWNQGKIGSPATGSDGKGTGKHLETNLDGIQTISQTFKLLDNIKNTAIFSFDAWSRAGGTGKVSVFGSQSGNLLSQAISMNGTKWTQNLFNLNVKAGEEITVAFVGDQKSSVLSPHIDQVSFQVSVPEPASMLGLLAVGTFGTVSVLKQKRKQNLA